jgi:hypothetical protein
MDGNYIYAGNGSDPMTVVDVSNPAAPAHVATINTTGTDMAIKNGYVFIADPQSGGGDGLSVVDIADHSDPDSALGSYATTAGGDLVAVGDLVYLIHRPATELTLDVLDVSTPTTPTSLGTVTLPPGGSLLNAFLAVSGTHAVLATDQMLCVLDVTDSTSPSVVGSTNFVGGTAFGVALSWPYAYVARGFGVYTWDLTTPSTPTETGSVTLDNLPHRMQVVGNLLHVAIQYYDGVSGLQILDITNPAAPTLLGATPSAISRDAYAVAADTNHAYVSFYGNAAFWVVDVSNPLSPTVVDEVLLPYTGGDIAFGGGYAYVANRDLGVFVVDVSTPGSAVPVGRLNQQGESFAVAASNGLVHVAAFTNGMVTYPGQCGTASGIRDEAPAVRLASLDVRAHPNPFNPTTTIAFTIAQSQHVRVTIVDPAGRRVATLVDQPFAAGRTEVMWKGRDDSGNEVASGVYFARVETASASGSAKLVFLK